MKKIIAALFCFMFTLINSNNVYARIDVPDQFNVTEHWVSMTTSFDIETRTRKLGTLYRRFFSLLLTYDFYDPYDNQIATARAKFFSLTAHFDIYDMKERFLGYAEEQFFALLPTFQIYGRDSSNMLASAEMNFLGTTFTIYDPVTNDVMATMYRPFFRLKNDWSITITNKPLFESKHIDPRVLMTVIAFQGDRENWMAEQNTRLSTFAKSTASVLKPLKDKIAKLSDDAGLAQVQKPDESTLEQIAAELESNYKNDPVNTVLGQTSQERLNGFVDSSLKLVESKDVSDAKKKGILYLLKMRLNAIG